MLTPGTSPLCLGGETKLPSDLVPSSPVVDYFARSREKSGDGASDHVGDNALHSCTQCTRLGRQHHHHHHHRRLSNMMRMMMIKRRKMEDEEEKNGGSGWEDEEVEEDGRPQLLNCSRRYHHPSMKGHRPLLCSHSQQTAHSATIISLNIIINIHHLLNSRELDGTDKIK